MKLTLKSTKKSIQASFALKSEFKTNHLFTDVEKIFRRIFFRGIPKSFEILLHCNSGVAKFSIAKQTELKVLQFVSVIVIQHCKKHTRVTKKLIKILFKRIIHRIHIFHIFIGRIFLIFTFELKYMFFVSNHLLVFQPPRPGLLPTVSSFSS